MGVILRAGKTDGGSLGCGIDHEMKDAGQIRHPFFSLHNFGITGQGVSSPPPSQGAPSCAGRSRKAVR